MKLKEKCIYYNPVQKGYYLVLSIDDEMIYGRRGDWVHTTSLEDWINQDGPGIRFKIDNNIIINRDYIRNYYLNEECLNKFELVRELTDEEFYLIDTLIDVRRPQALTNILIDIDKSNTKFSKAIIDAIKERNNEIIKLKAEIRNLERELFDLITEYNE